MRLNFLGDFIVLAHDVFEPDYCNSLIKRFEDKISPLSHNDKLLYRGDRGISLSEELPEDDKIVFNKLTDAFGKYCEQYPELSNSPVEDKGYVMQVLYPKKMSQPHIDWRGINFGLDLSCVVFLNDSDSEIEFLYGNARIRPKTGSVLMYPPYWTHQYTVNWPKEEKCYFITTFFGIKNPLLNKGEKDGKEGS